MRRIVFKVRFFGLVLLALVAGAWPVVAQAAASASSPPPMGAALLTFAVLGNSTVTNTGPSVVTGNVGVSPGTAVTGFPPGTVKAPSAIHAGDTLAGLAHSQLTIAYNAAAGAASTANVTTDLGGLTLNPGVYTFSSSAQLTGNLTLSGSGVYIFQIGSTITTASGSQVLLIKGAQACAVFWQVGTSATLGTTTKFQGNILASASITLTTGATLNGRALAGAGPTGAVTMDTNTITRPTGTCTSASGSCNQGTSKDKDENADQSKDTSDSNRSAFSSSKSDKDKGSKGCDSDNSKGHNSNQDMSKQDNSNQDNKKQSD